MLLFRGTFLSLKLNLYYFLWQYQMPTVVRDGTSTRPKGSRLERAIKDLEKIVAECKSINLFPYLYNMFLCIECLVI
jgi:hypothetical protein